MTKAKPIRAVIALWLLAFSLVAIAQQPATVGDLLDKGGKKLTKDEVQKLLTGATISGISAINPQSKFVLTYKPDGSASGYASIVVGAERGVGVFGTWSVSEQGQPCANLRNSRGGEFQNCSYYFILGNVYYQALTDERSAAVYEREVKR